jgi:hypothetical protein
MIHSLIVCSPEELAKPVKDGDELHIALIIDGG